MNPESINHSEPIEEIYKRIDSWYYNVFGLKSDSFHNMLFLKPGTPSTIDFSRLNREEKELDRHLLRGHINRPGVYTGNRSYMFGASKKLKNHVGKLRREGIALADYLIHQSETFPEMAFEQGSMVGEALEWLSLVFPMIKSRNGTMKGTIDRGGYFRPLCDAAGDLFEVMDEIAEEHGYTEQDEDFHKGMGMFGMSAYDGEYEYLRPEELSGPEELPEHGPIEYEEKPFSFEEIDDGRMSHRKIRDLRRLEGLILLSEFGEIGVYREIEETCDIWEIDKERVDRYIEFRAHDYDSRTKDFFAKHGRLEKIEVMYMLKKIVDEGVETGKLDTLDAYSGMITSLAISLAQSFEDDPNKGAYCPEWNMVWNLQRKLEDYLSVNGL